MSTNYLSRTNLLHASRSITRAIISLRSPVRFSSSNAQQPDVRTKLRDELKQAMKSKDTFRTTTIRSVLAEITNADKANKSSPITHASIFTLLQKSIARRTDSSTQFRSASRPDLAQKEDAESELLSSFLPAQLTEDEIEQRLHRALEGTTVEGNPGAVVGKLMKAFYESTDRASVKADVVSRKAREIVQAAASKS